MTKRELEQRVIRAAMRDYTQLCRRVPYLVSAAERGEAYSMAVTTAAFVRACAALAAYERKKRRK